MKEFHCEDCDRRTFDFNEEGIRLKCPRCGEYTEVSYEELKEKAKKKS